MLKLSEDQWVSILTVVSVVSAAGFGLLGLFTDYKKCGKITFWGRLAAAGIGLSAALSILLNIAQSGADSRKKKEARDEASQQQTTDARRYTTQLLELRTLANSMKHSLQQQDAQQRAQQQIIGDARSALAKTDALSRQEQGNSTRTLHSLWENATHVSGDTILAGVTFLCGKDPISRILSDDALASLVFNTPREGGGSVETAIQLPLIRFVRSENMAGPAGYQSYIFSGGIGELGRYEQLENWSGAAATLVVRSVGRETGLTAARPSMVGEVPGRELFTEYTGALSTFPCTPQLNLIVAGRDLVNVEGAAYQTTTPQGDIPRGTVYAAFPGLPFNSDEIPRFGSLTRRK